MEIILQTVDTLSFIKINHICVYTLAVEKLKILPDLLTISSKEDDE